MPELPEVETTLRGVAPYVLGQQVVGVTVRERRLRWPVPEALESLVGVTFATARRRGKYLLFGTPVGTVLIHLGMSGGLRVVEPTTDWKKHDHVGLLLSSGKQLRYHDPRRFGCILLADSVTPETHPLLADLGPEPLEADFTAAYLFAASRQKTGPVKPFVMDSKVVVGVGNIYANEALFMAGIRPNRPTGKITRAECERLVDAIKRVLAASIESGGTTLRDFLHEDGAPGYFKQSLRVYDREGGGCIRCTGTVKCTVLGQRATYYCPQCQR
jgi:formamidopyrimidine-DNA glycosylase